MRLPRWAVVILRAVIGWVVGSIVGFFVSAPIGFALDPGSNPHNYDGILRGLVIFVGTVLGGIIGFVTMLVRSFRARSVSKPVPPKVGDEDLA